MISGLGGYNGNDVLGLQKNHEGHEEHEDHKADFTLQS